MFTVPDLTYAKDVMSNYIDAQTMEIHHDKHHAAYVTNLNNALKDEKNKDFANLDLLQLFANEKAMAVPVLRNNAGGHYNHTFFWETIGTVDTKLEGKLLDKVNESFGSFENFKTEFKTKALGVFGSGWAWLCEKDGKLHVVGMPNQDNPLMNINGYNQNGKPILGIDVWEHAYYLKYQNRRADYIDAFFHVINWKKVAEKL